AVLPAADGRAAAAIGAGGVRLPVGRPPRAAAPGQRPAGPPDPGADAEPVAALAGRPSGVRAGPARRAGAAGAPSVRIALSHDMRQTDGDAGAPASPNRATFSM